jgi:hypothetical protein
MGKNNIVEVVIGFDLIEEKIKYIKSGFLDKETSYKDPIIYTATLIEMALAEWISEKIGVFCPNCDEQMEKDWAYCPSCGWNQGE